MVRLFILLQGKLLKLCSSSSCGGGRGRGHGSSSSRTSCGSSSRGIGGSGSSSFAMYARVEREHRLDMYLTLAWMPISPTTKRLQPLTGWLGKYNCE